jgi:hypothetical protein
MFSCSYIEADGWFIEGYLYGTVLDEEACAIVKITPFDYNYRENKFPLSENIERFSIGQGGSKSD